MTWKAYKPPRRCYAAEALAVVAALQAAAKFGIAQMILGSNSQNLFDKVNVLHWRYFDLVTVLYIAIEFATWLPMNLLSLTLLWVSTIHYYGRISLGPYVIW